MTSSTTQEPRHFPPDSVIESWIEYAKAKLPEGDMAMTDELLPYARIITLGSALLKERRGIPQTSNQPMRDL